MPPCHSYYIYATWRSKEVGGCGGKYGGKLKRGNHKVKGDTFYGEVDLLGILSELPIYYRLF